MSSILKVDEIQNTDGKTGLVITPDGSIDGIKFPEEANPSGRTITGTTMSSYEEGEWTPVWLGSTSNPTVSYFTQEGRYVKIGSFVYVKLRLDITSSSGGNGVLLIGGLPFDATNDGGALGVASLGYKNAFVNQGPDYGRVIFNHIELYNGDGASEVRLTPSNLGSNTQCIFTAVYDTTE